MARAIDLLPIFLGETKIKMQLAIKQLDPNTTITKIKMQLAIK